MRISEVVKFLNKVKKQRGDLSIVIRTGTDSDSHYRIGKTIGELAVLTVKDANGIEEDCVTIEYDYLEKPVYW